MAVIGITYPSKGWPKNTAVASSRKPISCLTTSPQGPVRGNRRASSGNRLSTKYGNAMPTPTVTKTANPSTAGRAKAQVSRATNRPNVHGVLRAAVSMPNRKLPV